MRPALFFAGPAKFRDWLAAHHAEATELLVGFHKLDSGQPSLTWPESVDEALCFGWIDGVRRRIDETSYSIRFTPRKAASVWSAVNIAKVAKLEAEGRMTEAGRTAFARRRENRSGIYAYEQRPQELPPEYRARARPEPAGGARLRRPPARVQEDRDLEGREREAGGDAPAAPRAAHRLPRPRRAPPGARPHAQIDLRSVG